MHLSTVSAADDITHLQFELICYMFISGHKWHSFCAKMVTN